MKAIKAFQLWSLISQWFSPCSPVLLFFLGACSSGFLNIAPTPEATEAPNSIAMWGGASNVSANSQPKIMVGGGGALIGRKVTLFADALCQEWLGSATVGENGLAEISLNITTERSVSIFATTTHNGKPSGCENMNFSYTYDVTPPSVTQVTATTADGVATIAQPLVVTVQFSEAVQVTGSPYLVLQMGVDRYASYVSGSGTNTLVFSYAVQSGDTSPDLDYVDQNSLVVGAGGISDLLYEAELELPAPGAAGSLGANKAIVVDGVAPRVESVSATNSNGSYQDGDPDIEITVTFDDDVTVDGSPRLVLETGSTNRQAVYDSGSGTRVLTFLYEIQDGDSASDLDYYDTASLLRNGATLRDANQNNAILTLPTPGASGSLAHSKNIVINTNPFVLSLVTLSTKQNGGLDVDYGSGNGIPDAGTRYDWRIVRTYSESGNSFEWVIKDWAEATISSTTALNFDAGAGTYRLELRYVTDATDAVLQSTTKNFTLTDDCPSGYVLAASSSTYTLGRYCISKYEMSSDGVPTANSVPTATPSAGTPWTLSRNYARIACTNQNPGLDTNGSYQLATNAQWQSAARGIEAMSINWSGNTVGSAGGLSMGLYSGESNVLAASTSDANPCVNTVGSPTCTLGVWAEKSRIQFTNTGQLIWDMSGNGAEYVSDDDSDTNWSGGVSTLIAPNNYMSLVTDAAVKLKYGPAGDYSVTHSTYPYGNLGYALLYTNLRSGIIRGGWWGQGGLYRVNLTWGTSSNSALTFRCVYNLP